MAMSSSRGDILYVKGMDVPDTEEEEDTDEDAWDDTKLKEAYDKGVLMANAEIAKRIAMSTNKGGRDSSSKPKDKGTNITKSKSDMERPSSKNAPPQSIWKAGMACRALYDCDGLEYEAFVLRIVNDKECVVRFLGYENSELVSLSTLKPSLGKEARARQIEQAYDDAAEDPNYRRSSSQQMEVDSDRTNSPSIEPRENRQTKKKRQKKPKSTPFSTETPFSIPNLPNFKLPSAMPIPNLLNLSSSMSCPIPPPPPTLAPPAGPDTEEAAVSSMLLSWYMSGYTTGYYQGLRKSRETNNKN